MKNKTKSRLVLKKSYNRNAEEGLNDFSAHISNVNDPPKIKYFSVAIIEKSFHILTLTSCFLCLVCKD